MNTEYIEVLIKQKRAYRRKEKSNIKQITVSVIIDSDLIQNTPNKI
jgi:hypothetical protein